MVDFVLLIREHGLLNLIVKNEIILTLKEKTYQKIPYFCNINLSYKLRKHDKYSSK